jgi:hypothetical protein
MALPCIISSSLTVVCTICLFQSNRSTIYRRRRLWACDERVGMRDTAAAQFYLYPASAFEPGTCIRMTMPSACSRFIIIFLYFVHSTLRRNSAPECSTDLCTFLSNISFSVFQNPHFSLLNQQYKNWRKGNLIKSLFLLQRQLTHC